MATCTFAHKGDAVAIELDTDLDISRGAVLSEVQRRPINADVLEARLVWLAEAPFDPEAGYLLRTATDLTPVTSMSVSALVDFETLASTPAHACAANDIADCRILLGRATSLDLFADLPATGNFILVSAVDGTTVAGGVISWAQAGAATVGDNVFVLDRELLSRGLCSDLGEFSGGPRRIPSACAGSRNFAPLRWNSSPHRNLRTEKKFRQLAGAGI